MKIAIFSELIYKAGGGSQMAMINFANTLSQKGHEVILLTIGRPYKDYVKDMQCEVFSIRTLPFTKNVGIGYFKVLKKVKEFKPDVIHLNELFSSFVIGLLVSWQLGVKNVTSFHTLYAENRGINKVFLSFGHRLYTKVLLSLSDEIIAPTNFAKKYLQKLGITKKIHLLNYPIIDISVWEKYLRLSRNTKKKSDRDNLNIVTVSRLSKGKNIDIAIKAINKIKDLPVKFSIIGDGKERSRLESLVIKLGIENIVKLKGAYPRAKVLREIRDFDVFLSTSTMETFGITYIEAIMLGLPLICIDQEVTQELLSKFSNVFFVKKLDIDEVVGVIEEFYKLWFSGRLKKGIKNFKELREFTYSDVTDTLVGIYRKAISSNIS